MSSEGFTPVIVDTYGGLCTLMDKSDLPVGLSPDCHDVEFYPGGVRSRAGFMAYQASNSRPLAVGAHVNQNDLAYRLSLWSDGTVKRESARYSTPVNVATGMQDATVMQTTTAYGRTYVCLSDGQVGKAIPFQWDENKSDVYAPVPVSRASAISATVANAAGAGNVSVGLHYMAVLYETEDGYVTSLPGLTYVSATGGKMVDVTNIPIGPGNVTKRILFFSPANSADLYSLDRFVITDNLTTSVASIDFTDAELLNGDPLSNYSNNMVLPQSLGSCLYHNRMFYWGGASQLEPFLDTIGAISAGGLYRVGLVNLSFDACTTGTPLPWGAPGAGGSLVQPSAGVAEGGTLTVYQILGDGATVARGAITQTRNNYGDSGAFFLTPGRKYGIRARTSKSSAFTDGGITVTLYAFNGVAAYTLLATHALTASNITTYFTTTETDGTVAVPKTQTVAGTDDATQVEIRVTGSGATPIPLNAKVWLDWIEIYDIAEKNAGSVVYASGIDDPETFSRLDGFLNVYPGNGQRVTRCFEMRGNLYLAKQRSLYSAIDNGEEPALWTIDEVSNTVGTPSVHGVAVGDGWAVLASENGAFLFSGGMPEKVSQEIEPTWRDINWKYGHKIWSMVDTSKQRVYIGVPVNGAVECNRLYTLDYQEGWGNPIPTGSGRKWTYIDGTFPHGCMVIGDDGVRFPLLCCGDSQTAANNMGSEVSAFGVGTWQVTSGGSPTVTSPYADPIGTTAAWRWVVGADSVYHLHATGTPSATSYLMGSVFIKPTAALTVTVAVAESAANRTARTELLDANVWKLINVYAPPGPGAAAPYLELTLPAGTYYVYGQQLWWSASGAPYLGYVKNPGGLSGTIYALVEPNEDETMDFSGSIDSRYETAPIGEELGVSKFDKGVFKISGEQTITGKYERPDGTEVTMGTAELEAIPLNDVEVKINPNDTQICIIVDMLSEPLGYWSMRRAGLLIAPATTIKWRGRNP